MHSFQIHLLACSCSVIISPQLVPVLTHLGVVPENSTPREILYKPHRQPPCSQTSCHYCCCVWVQEHHCCNNQAPTLAGEAQQLQILTSKFSSFQGSCIQKAAAVRRSGTCNKLPRHQLFARPTAAAQSWQRPSWCTFSNISLQL